MAKEKVRELNDTQKSFLEALKANGGKAII